MGDVSSTYKVIEVIGTSEESWEDAAKTAVETATESLRDARVAEVKELDIRVGEDKLLFRAKLSLSFRYEGEE
ncbi:MAG: dodecin domain-containing protein [Firmicutes bacterium]|nr:dodecin domain-containing protein [Bacillota bacterium]